ncbi:hypothetical protein BCV72DRAFT_254639 [Rhizopus microsporus var. microsporus]|uniref:RGS domain-containing protein n=2 Tax=Rhizopus microsporus TaxID=58291 RepID=A0A2G4T1D0_RHIZD|nr:uncharacterized protein RHIMIDRAFT_290439 [Rhizopus microsporus ATCC 52813]ORE09775.1 hypothetical protein BCV72DRAFT_254639 [Rhizopus microsporus var. microsporus]PHZ14801.1 hypothetical protein RHIMIDRAFT_290439 [Rhizopus microsporus ATCC 52813]
MFQDNTTFANRWSIRQANSRLHALGIQTALEEDLSRKIQHDEKLTTGIAIPLNDLNSTNPYLTSMPMIQKPSKGTVRSLKTKTYGFKDPFAVAPMEAWQEIKDYNLRVNGLPTLEQMMRLNTYSPLTQSHFSTFLRRRKAQQNLSFLMELETHDKLWRAYLQSVDRQNRQRLSRFLESAAEKEGTKDNTMVDLHQILYVETPDTEDLLSPLPLPPQGNHYASRTAASDKSLSRQDLIDNATRIYNTYCSPTAQRVHLPEDYRRALEELVVHSERPEPVVFESARSHVFEILNVFYYPLFVDYVLHKNISIGMSRLCLGLGTLLLTLAFSIELSLIFLASSTSRWLALIPFFFGWSALLTSITEFAWWFGISSVSEVQFMVYSDIQDVIVKKIHRKRGWLWLAFIILLSILNTLIFVFIPSHRL